MRSTLILLTGTLATAALAGDARAHDATIPISGKILKIDTRKEPAKHKVTFVASKDVALHPTHDPRTTTTQILLRWTGEAGVGAGRTDLLTLDPAKWAGLGNPAGSKGYKYVDKEQTVGGIKKVLFKPGNKGGLLKIIAGGENFPWEIDGPQDSTWVHYRSEDEWHCAELGGDVKKSETGFYVAKKAPAPTACPDQVCGNGILELTEECDDGNATDDDGCNADCTIGSCGSTAEYASTFEAIQAVVFEGYGCNTSVCHGWSPGAGMLDLTAANAYAQLVGPFSTLNPTVKRVEPGEPIASVLYDRLAAKTNGTGTTHGGTPMPVGPSALTPEHLEAVELWIRGGAPEDLVVDGTSGLLGTCLPPPDPLVIDPPAPPGAGVGVQLRQTPWPLPAESEDEICMATYYDFTSTSLVPTSAKAACSLASGNNPSGDCLLFHRQLLVQDPQSHHSIIHLYEGAEDWTHGSWGSWTYKFQDESNPLHGQPCDPTAVDPALGYNPGCSSDVVSSIACIGYGPGDSGIFFAGGFSGSQEPYYDYEFVDGVYDRIPMSGLIVWNSHAFNATQSDSTMSQYLNLDFAGPADQSDQVRQIFDIDDIFAANVPPFETREYCANYVIPNGSNLFQLSSHTHRFGVRFRIWEPPNTNCSISTCGPGDPSQLIYESTVYTDPIQLRFDPPVVYSGTTTNRRFRFCSEYDNGSTPTSPSVKLSSNPLGSGCAPGLRACVDGPNKGILCGGDDSFCDSSPGAGDGSCDACPAVGGFTTEDEMFILLGSFY